MVQAVGSPANVPTYGSTVSTSVLQSQLDRYQVQLDDWCHCPSAKTPEGKAKIQDLTNKVDTLKAQILQATQQQPSSLRASTNVSGASSPGDRVAAGGTIVRGSSEYSSVGSRLDAFA